MRTTGYSRQRKHLPGTPWGAGDGTYELAAEGESLGRLVAVTDDARSQLVHREL
ncbi:hypothetical protein AB0M87_31040 [Streptomyces sp. NPDC051320]|uniref:hypothetical protein n=1 Tax=Streptomyces sp. NPDC051320 TaxID=3154644 RepID=UPI003444A446